MMAWRKVPLLSDWIPFEDFLSDKAILLGDGSAYAAFDIAGRSAETADVIDLNRWLDELNGLLKNICDNRVVYTTKLCRGEIDAVEFATSDCDIPFVSDLDVNYKERLLSNTLYFNKLYVTIQYRPTKPAGEWIGDAVQNRMAKTESADDSAQDRLQHLERICAVVEDQLAPYGPRRLGMVQRGHAMFNEIAEAEVFAMTGVWRSVPMTTGRIGNTMFSEDVTFHYEHIEIRGPGWTTVAAHLGMKEYPAQTWPGIFNSLLAAPYRLTLQQSFRMMEQSEGQDVITRKQNRMVWGNDKAYKQLAGLSVAANDLQSGDFVMGDHNLTLCLFADRTGGGPPFYERLVRALRDSGLPPTMLDIAETTLQSVLGRPDTNPLANVVNAAWRGLGDSGCTVARENKALMAAWLSMAGGNHKHRVRPGAISSRNYAAMNPLYGYRDGEKLSRWGEPIAITRTTGGTPYRYHWHDGEGDSAVGNTFVSGEMGSGKSTGVGFLLGMTAARIQAQGGTVIGLDHKRGWNALFHAMGGGYGILGGGEAYFAPMKALPNTPRSLEFLTDLLRGCIKQGGWRELTAEENRRLALGIEEVMKNDPADRWIGEVQAFLSEGDRGGEGAGARLKPWCHGEELGWVLDAPRDKVDMDGPLNGFDTTRLLESPRARGPSMAYLFFRIEMRLDGRPILIGIDEGWRALEEPEFKAPINKSGRTIRSKNGVLVFITQSPSDAVKSGIAESLIEQCPNQMHFSNPRASRSDYIDGLKRTQGEYEALMSIQKGSGQFLLCKGSVSSIQQLPLHGMSDKLAILSASEQSLRAIDQIPEDVRADPVRFVSEFHRIRKLRKTQVGYVAREGVMA